MEMQSDRAYEILQILVSSYFLCIRLWLVASDKFLLPNFLTSVSIFITLLFMIFILVDINTYTESYCASTLCIQLYMLRL